jgi:DNA polymerase-3 subunit epsilon
MNYTVIDFETANQYRNSACAIGLVRVEENTITHRIYNLIRPQNLYFNARNVEIHGITPSDVENEPEFDELYVNLQAFLEDTLIVAHNAPFDMGVLKACLETYDIALPKSSYMDSVSLSRKLWPHLINHKLNTVANYHGFQFMHHHALEDAEVTAKILIKATFEQNVSSITDLAELAKINIKFLK